MELSKFIYGILPLKEREKLDNKKNVKCINEFLRKRRKLQITEDDGLAHLKQLRKDRSIDTRTYDRMKQVMVLAIEKKRIDLLKSITEKCVRKDKSVNGYEVQQSEDD